MKARWKWIFLGFLGAMGLAAGVALAWIFWGPFSFESAEAKVKEEAVLLNGEIGDRLDVSTKKLRVDCRDSLAALRGRPPF
jgi:hypothetical protein